VVGDPDRGESAEFQPGEAIADRGSQQGDLLIEGRWQQIERVVAVLGVPDRGNSPTVSA
jgi:hypothetical protein